jgi:hypothetical protein
MELKLRPTGQIVTLIKDTETVAAVVEARVWEGEDEHGTKVFAFISRVAVHVDAPAEVHARFGAALRECTIPPSFPWPPVVGV